MDDKKITPQEGIAIISQMIDASKQRTAMPNLSISIMWTALSVITAAVVGILLTTTGDAGYNWLWFAIPVIGIPLNIIIAGKIKKESVVKTYIDRLSDGVWRIVGYVSMLLTVVCIIFWLCGHPEAWNLMLLYAFIVVGLGAAMQGVIIRELSYTVGGVFSVIAGFVVGGLMLSSVPLYITWIIPLYILCFILMFIVPAAIIYSKHKKGAL